MSRVPIYLDNHATTRTDPRVVEAMLPFFTDDYGNASSPHHTLGRRAVAAVEVAREQVAALIGARPREIVFTSGATESNNLALLGVMAAYRGKGDHLITAVTEHKAVLETAHRLERQGVRVTILPVDEHGQVSASQVEEAITDRTVLVSLMAANNEVGTLHPLGEIGAVCRRRGVLFHTDAAQFVGKLPIDVDALNVDLMSLSAHKMYGPKGVGALYVRRPGVRLEPQQTGGGQERGLRSGTLPVPLLVGLGVASELCRAEQATEPGRLRALRDRLEGLIRERVEGVRLNGHPTERLPGSVNLSFAWVNGQALLMNLREVAVSSGSACTSADGGPSYVLRALGVEEELAQASLRFGLGRFTTAEEIDRAAAEVARVVERLREASPAYELHRHEAGRT